MPREDELSSIKYIGPYLEDGFLSRSFWPPGSNNLKPIRSKEALLRFVRTRGGQDLDLTKTRISLWLKNILKNERNGQCVEKRKMVGGTERLYKTRPTNLEGYNAIIQFLRENLRDTNHYLKIPQKLPHIAIQRKYPVSCIAQDF